jgi:hypothetical protein
LEVPHLIQSLGRLYIYTIGTYTVYYTASDFLNDTTTANPKVVEWIDKDDWVEFHLTVTDADNIICRDTTSIRFSMYSVFLGYLNFNINQGDSIFLNWGTNLSGGIPPYSYLWRPNHGGNDSTSLSFWAKPDHSIAYYVTVTDSAGCSIQGPYYYFINVIPVAIDEIEQNQIEIDIFPNPSQDLIFFKINREYIGEVVIEIFDNMSRLLISEKKSSNEFTVDVRGLKPGMYLYKISNSGQLIDTGKLFVNR